MTEFYPPDSESEIVDSLPVVFSEVLRKFLQSMDDMIPARVVAFDRAKARVTVQPLIKLVTTTGAALDRAQLANLPVLQIGGGNAMISFNLVAGDYGWVKASDRDLSNFMARMTDAAPPTGRMHSFADALFIPDVLRNFTITAEDAANMVIQNRAGTVRLALFPDRFKFTGLVTVEGDIRASGNIAANRPLSEIVP